MGRVGCMVREGRDESGMRKILTVPIPPMDHRGKQRGNTKRVSKHLDDAVEVAEKRYTFAPCYTEEEDKNHVASAASTITISRLPFLLVATHVCLQVPRSESATQGP